MRKKELGDEIGMAMSYGNIGSIYLEQKKIIPALNSYLKAVALSEKTNDQNGLCYFYNGVSSSYQAYKIIWVRIPISKNIEDF